MQKIILVAAIPAIIFSFLPLIAVARDITPVMVQQNTAPDEWKGKIGTIKICRRPRIVSAMDHKTVNIPAGDYVGACDKNGDNCRSIEVSAESVTIPANGKCSIISAMISRGDGKPLKKGDKLLSQWALFESTVTVVSSFR